MKKNIILSAFILLFVFITGCEEGDSKFKRTFTNNSSFTVSVSPAADNPDQGWVPFEIAPGNAFTLELKSHTASWVYMPADSEVPREKIIQIFESESVVYADK